MVVAAFEKLKENVESEAFRKRKVNFKSTKPRKAKAVKVSKD